MKSPSKKSHDTAVGPNDINYQILKHLPECTLDTLLNIYNQIWDNYRPIALTSCICKTFERMVNSRLVLYLEKYSIITAYQSGFRKKRSGHQIRISSLRGFHKKGTLGICIF